jgi:hydroxyacylglutathione hydrolase
MGLHIRTFTAAGFGENAYLVWRPGSEAAAAIDPGGEAGAMAALLENQGLGLAAILLTHAHLDHVEGVAELVRRTGAPIYMHEDDLRLYDRAAQQAAAFGLRIESPPPVDHYVVHGQALGLGGCSYEVRHVPGHSPGHLIYYLAEDGVAFVGDVVFMGSIGRTDLPGGNYQQLMRSIREQVLTLPPDTALFPGHGPSTTVEHERSSNPFLVAHYGGELT